MLALSTFAPKAQPRPTSIKLGRVSMKRRLAELQEKKRSRQYEEKLGWTEEIDNHR